MSAAFQDLLEAGLRCLQSKDWRSARKSLGQAVRKDPHDVQAQYCLAVALYHLGRTGEAVQHLQWVRKQPGHARALPEGARFGAVLELLARCHMTSDTDKAVELAQEGIQEDAKDPRLRHVLATALLRQRRTQEAWHHWKMAFKLEGDTPAFPDHPGLVPFSLSGVQVQLKRWKEALESVRVALEREPRNALYHNRRGVILYEGFGKSAEALEAVERAVELDPGTQTSGFDGIYHYNRALYLRELGRLEDAVRAVDHALAISPQQSYKALRNQLLQDLTEGAQIIIRHEETHHHPGPPERSGPDEEAPRKKIDFSHVGGMHALKEQIRRVMAVVHTDRDKAAHYGIERNGILFYGPPGCGKTFFAQAMAGEFGLNYFPVPLAAAQTMYVGAAGQAIAQVFAQARQQLPCLLFFDEFDAVATKRKDAGSAHEQQMVNALLQQIDAHRNTPGLIIAAATNRFDELDPAAIRDGRFDYKIRIHKPDFDARREILQVLLRDRPHEPDLDVTELAQDMEGFTAAQVRGVVDEAAMAAWEADAVIGEGHLREAYRLQVTERRYGGTLLGWDDLILPAETKKRLQFIEQYLENPRLASNLGVELPSGLLLYGPPGTGKTTIARVLASQTDASFFAVNASDIFTKWFGESERKVKDLFSRARDSTPAILFIDEADAVLGHRTAGGSGGDHARNSVINTFLAEMDGIEANQRLFIVAATNRPELLDDAVTRPGRLSEAVEIGLPSQEGRLRMLELFTRDMPLDPSVDLEDLATRSEGASGADLRGLCTSAGRNAFLREMEEQDDEHLVALADFEQALEELFPEKAWNPDQRRIGFS